MFQTRAGHCTRCGEETNSGDTICPGCGMPLNEWEITSQPAPAAAAQDTPARATAQHVHTFAQSGPSSAPEGMLSYLQCALICLVLCVITGFAVAITMRDENEVAQQHSRQLLIQDAVNFRYQIANAAGSAQSPGSTTPEAAYVYSVDMPLGSNILEITLTDAWAALDYPTRLQYARDFAALWEGIHLGHVDYFRLLDLQGNEVGGRTHGHKTWVKKPKNSGAASTAAAAPAGGDAATGSAQP